MPKLALTLAIIAMLCSAPALARDKTDIVWLKNGDRVTGEIKQLEHGMLRVSTDSMGEIRVEWNDVARIRSDYAFQFERTDGTRVTGTIQENPDDQHLMVMNDMQSAAFAHDNVVRISQIEDSFWDRMNGSLTFGYSFTKASNVAQGNLGFRATHRTEERAFSVDGSTIITSDQADENTQRSDLRLGLTRFRSNRWFNSYLVGFESNDELRLKLRTSIGAGMGRYLIQTNKSELSVLGGLAGSAENLDPTEDGAGARTGESSQENLEGLLAMQYARYVFDDPTVDFSVSLFAFPSITDSGRLRTQLDVNLRWELINDLFWDLNYYNTYDSDPPSGAESTSDYGIVTSIGWSF